MPNEGEKVSQTWEEERGKGKGRGQQVMEWWASEGLANLKGLITKHIFPLKVQISALEYQCTIFSPCVIDLRMLKFGDKQDL